MKHLKTYKLFESADINIIKDILLDLEDEGFEVSVRNKSTEWRHRDYIEIIIKKHTPGHNGGLMGFEFIWRDFKETIFRLMDYYYQDNDKPDIPHPKGKKIYFNNTDKRLITNLYPKSPFRLFGHFRTGLAGGRKMEEFAIGFTCEEDFNTAPDRNLVLGDYTVFEKVKILIKRD